MLESPPAGLDAPVAPKVKRQIFKNRPDWATPDSNVANRAAGASRANDDDNFFSRSTETLSSYAFDEERKKKKREPQEPQERTKKPDSKDETARQNVSKRRRLSESDSDYEELYAPAPAHASAASPRKPSKYEETSKAPDETSTAKSKGKQKKRSEMVIIDLSDNDDDNNHDGSSSPGPLTREPRSSSSSPMQSIEGMPVSNTLDLERDKSPPKQKFAGKPRTSSSPVEILQEVPAPPQPPPPRPQPPTHDPTLNILIHSRLPNTAPLIAQRKFSQRLSEVRKSWCQRQNLTPEQTEAVFLTWRGKRVFDFTTCKSLGIQVNDMGEVYIKGQVQPAGEEGAQIEMEAVTVEIMEEIQREKERKARAPQSEELAESAAAVAPAGAVEQTRIVLRSRDYVVYKLIVRATTKFGKIADAFRSHFKIPPDKEVLLMFEGEKLGLQEEMKDFDIGQMDYVDVYIK